MGVVAAAPAAAAAAAAAVAVAAAVVGVVGDIAEDSDFVDADTPLWPRAWMNNSTNPSRICLGSSIRHASIQHCLGKNVAARADGAVGTDAKDAAGRRGCIAGFREGRYGEIDAVVAEEVDPTSPATTDIHTRSLPRLRKAHTKSPMIVGEADPNAWIVGRAEQEIVLRIRCLDGLAGNTQADSSSGEVGVGAAVPDPSPSFRLWPAEVIVTVGSRTEKGRSVVEGS